MTREDAVDAIREQIRATVCIMKQMNRPGGPTKKAVKEEVEAASALFKAIIGEKPTSEEVNEMIGQ